MKRLVLAITENDILTAVHFRIGNPILFVLQRATRTLWRMNDDGTLAEVMAPYRTCQLSAEALEWWREYSQRGTVADCEIEMQVLSGVADDAGVAFHPQSKNLMTSDERYTLEQ
jgi:hypothetical protein